MSKKFVIVSTVVMSVFIIILNIFTIQNQKITKDEKYFKDEYERYNGKKSLDDVSYLSIQIDEHNKVKYVSSKEVIKILKNKTGVILFGYPQSAWTRHVVEPLLEVREETGLEEIYYYNAYSIRDEKYLDDNGKVTVKKEGTDQYYEILDELGEFADSYEGLEDNTIKRLYFPTVVFVKNGKVIDTHVSTVNSHTNSSKKLSVKEKRELKKIYREAIMKIQK